MRVYPKLYFLAQSFLAWLCVGSSVCANEFEDAAREEEIITLIIDGMKKRLDAADSSVVVVSESEMETLQVATVIDLMARLPGISISQNGGLGTTAALRIRGAEAGHTLVLIDGVRINDLSAPDGAYNFANLTVDNIERVEILSGPQSTLYGSDAIGGVVSIITKRLDQPVMAGATFEIGSLETARASAYLGIRHGDFSSMMTVQGLHTNGISAADDDAGNTEADGFDTSGARIHLSEKINEHLTLEGFWHFSRSWSEFDTFSFSTFSIIDGDGVTRSKEFQGALGASWVNAAESWHNSVRLSWARGQRRDHEHGEPSFDSNSHNRVLDFLSTFEASRDWMLLVGAQHQSQDIHIETFGEYASTFEVSTDVVGVFGETQIKPLQQLNLTMGVRRDHHQSFGGYTTWRAAAVYRLSDMRTLFRANWGTAYKAPTLFQLFSPFGDPALRPEESKGWEVAVESELLVNQLHGSLVYFQRSSTNQIDFDLQTSQFTNLLTTRASGMEARVAISYRGTTAIDLNYTHINAFNAETGLVLPRRPKNLLNLNVDHHLTPKLSLGLGVFFSGRQQDGESFLDAYKTVDLRAQYSLSQRINFFARIENIFDEDYQMVRGYGTRGLSLFFGLRARY